MNWGLKRETIHKKIFGQLGSLIKINQKLNLKKPKNYLYNIKLTLHFSILKAIGTKEN